MKKITTVLYPNNDISLRVKLLVRLRWGSIALLFLLLSYSFILQEKVISSLPLISVLAMTLLFNLALHFDLARHRAPREIMKVLNFQFCFDVFFYLFVFHFTGGVESPFFILLLFPAISASIIFYPPGNYFRALIVLILFGILVYAEAYWQLNPPFVMVISAKERGGLLFLALTGAIFLSVYLTANLVQHLRKRLKSLVMLQGDLQRNYFETVTALAQAVEAKDSDIRGHLERTVWYATAIGKKLGLDEETMESLKFGAVLHDVGKIGVEQEILIKPAKLTQEEREEIKCHPEVGADIIDGVEFLRKVKPVILYHHERYDGEGYPGELKGENIPLLARIMTVVDAYDAMTSNRPYAKARTCEKAGEELVREKSKQFDPKIVDIFLQVLKEM